MADPFYPTDHQYRVCAACDYPYAASLSACPNPGCRPDMKADNARRAERARARAAWINAKQTDAAASGVFYQPGVLESIWNRDHPESDVLR